MWILWFLWFLCVECSSNPLYKPLCAFLVFVDLLWFLCGSFCGFWSRVVFGSGLRVRSCSCGFCGSVVLPSMLDACQWSCASTCPHVLRVPSTSCGFCGSVVLPSMLMLASGLARPLALCGSVVFPSMLMLASGLARPLARMSCASAGFPYCQKAALGLQVLARAPPLVVPTKRRPHAWLELAPESLRRPPMDARSLQADGNQNSRMRA